jgi:hypothetical protein
MPFQLLQQSTENSPFSTMQQFNKHLFLLNHRQPGSICTSSYKASAAAAQMPCPGPECNPPWGPLSHHHRVQILPYRSLGVWPIGGRIPFIKCCEELFFVHHGTKYTVRVNEPRRSEGGGSLAAEDVRRRGTWASQPERLAAAPAFCPAPRALSPKSGRAETS